jgi:hypothetical protein
LTDFILVEELGKRSRVYSTIYATWPLKKYHDVPLRVYKAHKNTITFYKVGISVATMRTGILREID